MPCDLLKPTGVTVAVLAGSCRSLLVHFEGGNIMKCLVMVIVFSYIISAEVPNHLNSLIVAANDSITFATS